MVMVMPEESILLGGMKTGDEGALVTRLIDSCVMGSGSPPVTGDASGILQVHTDIIIQPSLLHKSPLDDLKG
jgi:hypothetical protein